MHGVKRVIVFCILIVFVPSILIIIPLYLRHSVFAEVIYPVAESDIIEIRDGISSVFCQKHSLHMNTNFNAFQLTNKPEISANRKHIRLKKSMVLPDDTLEYWGFYLLKGAKVELKFCSRYDGSRILVVKGERNLQTCGLLEHNKNKVGTNFAEGHEKVKIVFEDKEEFNMSTGNKSKIVNHNNLDVLKVSRFIYHFLKENMNKDEQEDRGGEDYDENLDKKTPLEASSVKTKFKQKYFNESDKTEKTFNKKDFIFLLNNTEERPSLKKKINQQKYERRSKSITNNSNNYIAHSQKEMHYGIETRFLASVEESVDQKRYRRQNAYNDNSKKFQHINLNTRNSNRKIFQSKRKIIYDDLYGRRKKRDHIYDRRITHGGNALNFTGKLESNSISSFENSLLSCYDGKILVAEGFPPSQMCTNVQYLATMPNVSHMITNHEVTEDGYYYYIFYSDNDLVRNDIHAIFDIFKPTFLYSNISSDLRSDNCVNVTNCTFPLNFYSGDYVVVEVPTRDGIEHDEDDITFLYSTCHPRFSIYIIFPISVLILILSCAFL